MQMPAYTRRSVPVLGGSSTGYCDSKGDGGP